MPFTAIVGSPPSTTTITKTGNGITPGLPDTYEVSASTSSGNSSPSSTPANYTYSTTAIPSTITDINDASFCGALPLAQQVAPQNSEPQLIPAAVIRPAQQ